jgi:hypothetical protein
MQEGFEVQTADAVNDLLLLTLPGHPLKGKVELPEGRGTRYERKTLATTDWRVPSHISELTYIKVYKARLPSIFILI